MRPGPVLGIDAGSVRVGLAASDPEGLVASPVATLPRRDGRRLWEALGAEISSRRAVGVVVGLPRRLDGGEGAAAAAARELAVEIGRRTRLPVELWDEWLTTAQAERALIASGLRRGRRRAVIDGVAAALMLQGWLDRRGRGQPGRPGDSRGGS